MELPFSGRTALVTGGTRGLGLATAWAFARQGAAVVISGRNHDTGRAAAEAVTAAGLDAAYVPADVSNRADVAALVDRTLERYGRLDFAINNAGISGGSAPTGEFDESRWDAVLATNLTGLFLCMKYEIPALLRQPRSAIVNMTSVAGLVGAAGLCAYSASKHGVVGLTKSAALDYATTGLRINAIAPAVVRTDLNERAFFRDPAVTAAIVAQHPVGRLGTAAEIAAAAVWLCSDQATFITGTVMPVDGGYLAR